MEPTVASETKGGAATAKAIRSAVSDLKMKGKAVVDCVVLDGVLASEVKGKVQVMAQSGYKLAQMERMGGQKDFESLWILVFYKE